MNIESEYRDGIWHRIRCYANNEKEKTANDGRNRITNPRKIRKLGEKETYRNLGDKRKK